MKTLMRTATILVLSLTTVPALAQSITHFGQPLGRHVSLVLRFDPTSQCPGDRTFFERFASGAFSSDAFRVPGDEILVVTSFNWQATGTPASFLTGSALEAQIQSYFSGQALRVMHTSPVVNVTSDLASSRRAGGTSNIPSGVRIGSGRFLCSAAFSRTITTTAFHTVTSAEINGYLIKK